MGPLERLPSPREKENVTLPSEACSVTHGLDPQPTTPVPSVKRCVTVSMPCYTGDSNSRCTWKDPWLVVKFLKGAEKYEVTAVAVQLEVLYETYRPWASDANVKFQSVAVSSLVTQFSERSGDITDVGLQ